MTNSENTETLSELLNQTKNHAVLSHLERQNAHSDLAYYFFGLLKDLDKSKSFSPNDYPFPYSAAYANNVIFGFCVGMQAVSFRLPAPLIELAVEDGGQYHHTLASHEWLSFPVFNPAVKPNLKRWVKHAYSNALKS